MNADSPVAVLWESLLSGALCKPPLAAAWRKAASRRRAGKRRSKARHSVYACKQQRGAFWCAEPCRPEKVPVRKKTKKVTFSAVVTVVEFAVA